MEEITEQTKRMYIWCEFNECRQHTDVCKTKPEGYFCETCREYRLWLVTATEPMEEKQ